MPHRCEKLCVPPCNNCIAERAKVAAEGAHTAFGCRAGCVFRAGHKGPHSAEAEDESAQAFQDAAMKKGCLKAPLRDDDDLAAEGAHTAMGCGAIMLDGGICTLKAGHTGAHVRTTCGQRFTYSGVMQTFFCDLPRGHDGCCDSAEAQIKKPTYGKLADEIDVPRTPQPLDVACAFLDSVKTDEVHRGALCDAHWEKVMTPFGMLRVDLELNYKNSPWAQAQGAKGWAASTMGEAHELFDAVRLPRRPPPRCPSCIELRKDHPIKFDHIAHHVHCTADTPKPTEIRDEMGDVLWNLITLAIVTGIDFDGVVQAARDKLRRRKPWIFGIGPIPKTAEEEHAMYLENKELEKREKVKP